MSSGRLGVLGVRGGSAPSPPESHLSLRPPRRAAGRARAGRGAALARGGGGSGGTVAVLAKRDAFQAIHSVAAEYAASSGCGGYVFSGSSDGASVFPLMPDAPC